jgi:hypothetical protein
LWAASAEELAERLGEALWPSRDHGVLPSSARFSRPVLLIHRMRVQVSPLSKPNADKGLSAFFDKNLLGPWFAASAVTLLVSSGSGSLAATRST